MDVLEASKIEERKPGTLTAIEAAREWLPRVLQGPRGRTEKTRGGGGRTRFGFAATLAATALSTERRASLLDGPDPLLRIQLEILVVGDRSGPGIPRAVQPPAVPRGQVLPSSGVL